MIALVVLLDLRNFFKLLNDEYSMNNKKPVFMTSIGSVNPKTALITPGWSCVVPKSRRGFSQNGSVERFLGRFCSSIEKGYETLWGAVKISKFCDDVAV